MAITTAGFTGAGNRISGASSVNAFDYLALGIGETDFAVGDIVLDSEITDSGLERADGEPSQSGAVTTWTKEWTATGSKTVTEAGLDIKTCFQKNSTIIIAYSRCTCVGHS